MMQKKLKTDYENLVHAYLKCRTIQFTTIDFEDFHPIFQDTGHIKPGVLEGLFIEKLNKSDKNNIPVLVSSGSF